MSAFAFALKNWSWLVPSTLCLVFGLYAGGEHVEVLPTGGGKTGDSTTEGKVVDSTIASACNTCPALTLHILVKSFSTAHELAQAGSNYRT
jgi:hypothetical protein